VKDAKSYAKRWTALYKKLKLKYAPEQIVPAKPVPQVVAAFMQWESTSKAADTALNRLWSQLIDLNDLRVSHPHELIEILGSRYPRAQERVDRLHDVLQEIYVREHDMTMRSLHNKGKKEVRAYLDTLPGMVPYVAAQVTLLCYDGHAVPVDPTLAELLMNQLVFEEEATDGEIASFLERQVRAGQGEEVHSVLRAWVDAGNSRLMLSVPKVVRKPDKRAQAAAKAAKKSARKSAKKTTKKPAKKAKMKPTKAAAKKKKKTKKKAKPTAKKTAKKTAKRPVRKKR